MTNSELQENASFSGLGQGPPFNEHHFWLEIKSVMTTERNQELLKGCWVGTMINKAIGSSIKHIHA
jgi:hypothetical protein